MIDSPAIAPRSPTDVHARSLPTLGIQDPPWLRTPDDLARLDPAFVRALGSEFDLALLAGRLCPVLLEGGQAAVFAVHDYLHGDQIAEVERMLRARGYRLAQVPRYALPATLLLPVARGQVTPATLRGHGGGGPITRRSALASVFLDMVRWGLDQRASDMHINISQPPGKSEVRYTIDGAYVLPGCFGDMSAATLLEVLAVAWMDVRGGNGAVFDPLAEQQGRIALEVDGRPITVRWASLAADSGPSVCLRLLRLDAAEGGSTLAELGYLPSQIQVLERARERSGGAIVLAGVVGSGKSTSIATLMRGIPATRKVITLEDPVEYRIGNALQNTVGRTLDATASAVFDAKLKTIKRSAMHDLLIGEVRDRDTGRAFMDLAGSGANVYTTTHTGSACMIPERLASDFVGVSRDFLATPGVLKLLVYQALLPRLCCACSLPFDNLPGRDTAMSWREWAAVFAHAHQLDGAALRARNPAGCPACRRPQLPQLYGLAGRTVVAETIEPDHNDRFLHLVRRRDNLALRRYVHALPRTAFADADMTGKRAVDCAVYKASQGQIDPRVIALRFDLPVDPRHAAALHMAAGGRDA
ncbi:ATPase, T2SS/T4P/T4SS family [Bordetella sp. BOR01]|uniref:ATPase, T2SS/T4P/T4SS family n=1 Tax=Bordetella sp. BOR01 TaxID=2854779 RepID=UPI001C457270|nr:ATPase, T2SS/T4P/T4SS family [Bordetella sp. BOR01]MBV7482368.1 Flp pilus assembly complex ATPase component TadA [Bordetella sp. BOR01]